MKVFVSNVDKPLGHNLSRLLALTVVGSRLGEDAEEEDEEQEEKKEDKTKEHYNVIGSLAGRPSASDITSDPHAAASVATIPGVMIETGDKKKDQARREAIEKVSVLGVKPKWVKEAQIIDKPKTVIAISTVMTWAKTKVESDDPDVFLAEDEYRRRKPHPNFKEHINIEKNIVKLAKKNGIKAYVIASGLVYHVGDSIFHYLLKAAWHNEHALPCYGDGSNALPTIHLDDLVNIVVEVVETSPETKYLVAVDDSKTTLYDISKAISESLGTGSVQKLLKEEAFLQRGLSQTDYDMLTVNLKLDPGHVKDMTFEWKYEAGLIENIPQIVQEFKDARGLWPIKIYIHGPPAAGKTFLAQKIADHYKIHLVDPDQVALDTVARLEARASGQKNADEPEEDLELDRELLNELKEAYKANNGRYPTSNIINFVRDKLRSMPCRNQGYVLDGFPNTVDEARDLFKPSDEDAKDDKGAPLLADEITVPEFVFTLEASDSFIKGRIMKLPESAVAGTRNSEEALTKRLEEYRKNNTDENTVLNFFDELELHPIILAVENHDAVEIQSVVQKSVGQPRNYGPSAEQITADRKRNEEARLHAEAAAAQERGKQEQDELERHKKAVADWNTRLKEIRTQEQEVLEAQSIPLRNYLMKHVMPTLTAGLIEVSKVRPEDPVDYLAEYLFKHNPSNA